MSNDFCLLVGWLGKPPGMRSWVPGTRMQWPAAVPIPRAGDRILYQINEPRGCISLVEVYVQGSRTVLVEDPEHGSVTPTVALTLTTELPGESLDDEIDVKSDRTVNIRKRRR